MVVFSNRRLGPSVEMRLSPETATAVLRGIAMAARPCAQARWEHELVRWLEGHATALGGGLDVGDIAWTPDHFEPQRRFLVEAIDRATADSEHASTLQRLSRMIEAHPRESVQVGRLWQWPAETATVRSPIDS